VAALVPGSAERKCAARILCERFGIERLIVTRAEQGYEAFDACGQVLASGAGIALPTVVDTVGAGDAFLAALMAQHVAGRAFAPALAMANRYAAAVCAERGALPDEDEFFMSWRWTLGLHAPTAHAA
jgi:fructokinase